MKLKQPMHIKNKNSISVQVSGVTHPQKIRIKWILRDLEATLTEIKNLISLTQR
jgi:hypothetical protein